MIGNSRPPDIDSIAKSKTVDLSSWNELTPKSLWSLIGSLTIGSWVLIIGTLSGLFVAGWSLSVAYLSGSLPAYVYAFHEVGLSPRFQRLQREQQERFRAHYSDLVDWQKLSAIVRGIAMDEPDGLKTPFEIAASLLAQVRSTGGTAHFLAGRTQHTITIDLTMDGEAQLAWDEKPSIVPRIAEDAGYSLTPEKLSLVNANLNWAQFSYLDDQMAHAVIYRDLDGSMGLIIREPND